MVKKFLKIAGVKSEADFYKKYPSEAAFFKAHPEAKDLKQYKQGGQQKKLNQLTNWTNDVDGIIPIAQVGKKLDIWGNPIPITQMEENPNAGQNQIGLNTPAGGSMTLAGNAGATDLANQTQMWGTGADVTQGGALGGKTPDSIKGIASQKFGISTGTLTKGLGLIGAGIKYSQQRKAEKEARDLANQTAQVTGVQAKAAKSVRQEPIKNINWHPWDSGNIVQQNTLFPSQGGREYQGNVLAQFGTRIGGNPSEIQNTYNPGNLYSDLGYEPLNDSDQVKQYYHGGGIPQAFGGFFGGTNPAGQAAGQVADAFGQLPIGEQNAGSGFGKSIGSVAGSLLGPVGGKIGGAIGGIIGGALDRMPGQTKAYQEQSRKNEESILGQQFGNTVHNQFGRVMEDGGWVSHDWQPQVISQFDGIPIKSLLTKDPMMDTLRTGGHITQNENEDMGPVSSMGMGGEMKTHWGGYAEPMSYNPNLPGDGKTYMFKGASHDDGGIGVTYGDNPVEVERGEPAVKLRDGGTGEDNMVVYGNLKIPNQYLSEIGDPKAKGKKFKNYVKDLSQQEARHNKTVEKNMNIIEAMDDITSFDQMTFLSANANIYGTNMKLKKIADHKINAATVQNAINEAAEEHGLDADALAKGKFKLDKKAMDEAAKWGKSIKKAQNGTRNKAGGEPELTYLPDGRLKFTSDDGSYYIVDKDKSRTMYDKSGNVVKVVGGKSQNMPAKHAMTVIPSTPVGPDDDGETKSTYHYPITPYKGNSQLTNIYNELIPYLRPTDQEALDPTQMYGEMYALATNQLDPVQAQLYRPLLDQPYDISLQDQLNANQADFNAIQRQTGYNPAAAATLASQKYAANSKVLADQFRANQAMKADVYNRNRATLNDAQLKNLAALDQQMVRQETAKSRTKEVGQAALNSISDKILKQKLANRTLSIYENMYNYRFDKSGRAVNMNPAFQPNIPNVLPVYDDKGNIVAYQKGTTTDQTTIPLPPLALPTGGKNGTKVSSKNRDILRAMKNL